MWVAVVALQPAMAVADPSVTAPAAVGDTSALAGAGDVPQSSDGVVIAPAGLDALTKVGTTKAGARVGVPRPRERPQPRGSAPLLMRTGFRAKDRGGEVSLQTSGAVELQTTRPGGSDNKAVFLLKRCRTSRRTDRLPLDTQFFSSSVTRVSLRQRGPDLEVAVNLRAPVTPVTREEPGPSGSSVWVLEFPAVPDPRTAALAR